MTKTNIGLAKFLGVTLFLQAVTSLIGGSIFLGPFDRIEITGDAMISISNRANIAYASIFLQMITAMVIIMLGVAMYQAARHINKIVAIIALSLYIFEATLLAVSQIFVFGLVEASHLFVTSSNSNLLQIGEILISCKEFAAQMAIIPFGVGAILFYYLLLKAEVLPKWLALWGIITVPLILISVPFIAFGVDIPLILLFPYVPFEFFTGIYILVKYRNHKE